jgi:hypothetical protein
LSDCGAKNIGVFPIVIPELEFGNVQMQIFFADLVVCPDDSTLQDRPKALNRVRVDCADNVLTDAVVNDAVGEAVMQPIVSRPGIGAEQADASGNGLADKPLKHGTAGVLNHARNDVALTADCTDYGSLARIAPPANANLFVPMPVSVVSADKGFINLDKCRRASSRPQRGRS